jgi:hypothetical protein
MRVPILQVSTKAPCPISFLTTGMDPAYMEEILALAKQRGIAVRDLRFVQDNYYAMKGSALRDTMTGGAKDIDLERRSTRSLLDNRRRKARSDVADFSHDQGSRPELRPCKPTM